MSQKEILGLIPARGGSKGIPQKNLALLAGQPLLEYTCRAALASRRLTRTLVSTDDKEIAEAGRRLGVEVVERPARLAMDETPMLAVIREVVSSLLEEDQYECEIIVLLQPTSPLRRAEHVDGAIDLLIESGADAVVSVVEVPHNFAPASLMTCEDGRLVPMLEDPVPLLRQQKPVVYARNGPAVVAARTASVMERGLYEGDVRGFEMDHRYSVDIDTELDLELAEFWLGQHRNTHRAEEDG